MKHQLANKILYFDQSQATHMNKHMDTCKKQFLHTYMELDNLSIKKQQIGMFPRSRAHLWLLAGQDAQVFLSQVLTFHLCGSCS